MIVHLQPVDTYFTCKLCRLYTFKTIPEMNRSWGNSLFSNVGDRSFLVSCGWGGIISIILGYYKRGSPLKILWWRWGFIIFFKSHRRSPPPHPIKNERSLNDQSLKLPWKHRNMSQTTKVLGRLSFLSPPFSSPWPNVEQNLIYICA